MDPRVVSNHTDAHAFAGQSRHVAKRARKRGLALGLIALGTITLGFASIVGIKAYRSERAIFFPSRTLPELSASQMGIARLEPVSFRAQFVTLRGAYAASKNGAAVMLVHGAGGNRTSVLPEARALAEAGYGVLLFDLPGHGESDGQINWGQSERAALGAATTFTLAQPDVKHGKLGAFGFSMGGYALIGFAAKDARIKALAIAAAPPDPLEQSRYQFSSLGPVTQIPANLALRWSAMELEPTARQVIGSFAPRPLLMIGGTADKTVPEYMVRDLFAAARAPKELHVIDGAEHGNYFQIAPRNYREYLQTFFDRALLTP
jgi:pimeloyl-ACP methyl ester carboxylesterase